MTTLTGNTSTDHPIDPVNGSPGAGSRYLDRTNESPYTGVPGLIFIGHQYDYARWAVAERPADTGARLYLAPCPNVSLQGVCRGNAPFPKAGPATSRHYDYVLAAQGLIKRLETPHASADLLLCSISERQSP